MNKENFQNLIDAIELNGAVNFNMATFMGVKDYPVVFNPETQKNEIDFDNMPMYANQFNYTGTNYAYFSNYIIDKYYNGQNPDDDGETLKNVAAFNCDTMGCIAGFAAALYHDWKVPSWVLKNSMYSNSPRWVDSFENTACEYLDISLNEGRKLFYNSDDCFWKWAYMNNLFPSLKMIDDSWNSDYDHNDNGTIDRFSFERYEWVESQYIIDFRSIDYKTASEALRMVMNEEIILCNPRASGWTTFGPNYKGNFSDVLTETFLPQGHKMSEVLPRSYCERCDFHFDYCTCD